MTINICITAPSIETKLDEIVYLLRAILAQEKKIMATAQDLVDEVAAEKTIDDGLLALINKLIANQNDPVALQTILDGMKSNISPLAAALVANTPAAPTP